MGGIVGAVAGPVIGGIFGNSAANTQADAANNASDLQRYIFDLQNSQQAPYREAGYGGLSNLAYLLGTGPQGGLQAPDQNGNQTTYVPNTSLGAYGSLAQPFTLDQFHEDPGYQFMLQQGQQALKASQAANGTLLSGAGLKGLDAYTQGLASQEYQQAFNNYNTNQTNLYNRLAGLSGTGQTANAQTGAAAQNYGNQAGNYITQAGSANAAGQLATGTGLSNLAANLGSAWSTGLNTPAQGMASSFNGSPINWNS